MTRKIHVVDTAEIVRQANELFADMYPPTQQEVAMTKQRTRRKRIIETVIGLALAGLIAGFLVHALWQ